MRVQDFDYTLPAELIAQYPLEQRSASSLLCLNGANGELRDANFRDLPSFLREHDLLVLNNTLVMKARLFGAKATGGRVEILVERVLDDQEVLANVSASHLPKPGSMIMLREQIVVRVVAREGEFWRLRFECTETVLELLDRQGDIPLPPYIVRETESGDLDRYQTVYARQLGAVAAPTAGLHFDELTIQDIQQRGVKLAYVTLHVGAGTFQPVRVEDTSEHKMHSEWYEIPEETISLIDEAKKSGGQIIAVGTTSLRALESAALDGDLRAQRGETNLFITPGFQFKVVERLLTNFHLPRSTLLMLVSAFAGMENARCAYRHAIERRYRFFSYGDAMLIDRNTL